MSQDRCLEAVLTVIGPAVSVLAVDLGSRRPDGRRPDGDLLPGGSAGSGPDTADGCGRRAVILIAVDGPLPLGP